MNTEPKRSFTFFVRAEIVGSFLPSTSILIEDFQLLTEEIPEIGWESPPEAPNASPDPESTGITINYKVRTENACDITFKVITRNSSSKEAQDIAEMNIKRFCSLLSIITIGGRYFYKIKDITMLPTNDHKHNTESPPSEQTLGVSYDRKEWHDFQLAYIQQMGKLSAADKTLSVCLDYFVKALDAEVFSSAIDDKAVLNYFKIIELVSNKLTKKQTFEEKKKEYSKVINTLTSDLKKQVDTTEKLRRLREAFSNIRVIDQSITSENIKNVAKLFGFNSEGLERISKVITMRNKIVVHPDADFEIKLEDNRDFRELAKIYIKEYCKRVLDLDFILVNQTQPVKEIGGWYRYTYTKSTK